MSACRKISDGEKFMDLVLGTPAFRVWGDKFSKREG